MAFADLVKTISGYAPLLGSVIGGPMGNMIGQVVADKFGGDINDPDILLQKINADPESHIKLRQIQAEETASLQRFAFLQAELAVKNTADARKLVTEAKSYFPQLLSTIVVVGFFGCVYWTSAFNQDPSDKDILNMMFGVVGSAFMAVINFWLGSSMDRKK